MAINPVPSLQSAVVNTQNGLCSQAWYRFFLRLSLQDSPGTIFISGAIVAPQTSLLCNGAAVSRTVYSGLFSAIGTTFGPGDGSTTFNIPNIAPVVAGAKYYIHY